MIIKVNLEKAKPIAHAIRRKNREKEFAPHDKIISLNLPGDSAIAAEAAREQIREKYTEMQQNINVAETVEALTCAISL